MVNSASERFLLQTGIGFAWGGKAVSRGQVLFVRSSTTSSSRRQCDGGGRSGLFSNCDSFISSVSCLLCQPPFWGCQSRPKLVPQEAEAAKAKGSCSHYWRRHIQHTGRLVFAFFDSITGGVFFECLRLVLLTRDWFRAQSVGEYLGGMFLHM